MSLRSLIVASAFIIAFSGISGAAAAPENFSPNIDRPGNDMRNVPINNAQACLNLCNRDRNCRAWTFVRPGIQGSSARCWLKDVIPPAVANRCCTSGVIRRNL